MPTDEIKNVPNWDKIEALYDKLDNEIANSFLNENMNFLEVNISVMMLNNKLTGIKNHIYMNIEKDIVPKTKSEQNIYG